MRCWPIPAFCSDESVTCSGHNQRRYFKKNRFVFGTDLRNLYSLTKFDLGFVAYITVRAVTYISMFFLSHFVHTVQEQLYIER